MPPVVISSNRCNVCFFKNTSSPRRLACSRCGLIRYCGREHQLLDWPIHKDFCKAVDYLKKRHNVQHLLNIAGPIVSRAHLEHATVVMNMRLRLILRRDLEHFETELISFPRICNLCLTPRVFENYDCKDCGVVSYCCAAHRQSDLEEHQKWCYHLRVVYNFFPLENFSMKFDFQHVVQMKSENHLFDILTKCCTNHVDIPKKPQTIEEYQPYNLASSYSSVVTVLYCLQLCSTLKPSAPAVTLFVAGARNDPKWFQKEHLRFFFTQLPGVSTLKIYFIGPELECSGRATFDYELNGGKQTAELVLFTTKFEEFVEWFAGNQSKPDLIVSFNCGFSEFSESPKDTWRAGIEKMLQFKDIPVVFTSYTLLESRSDLKEVVKIAAEHHIPCEIVVKSEENRFKDYTPLRNLEVSDTHDAIWFVNGYLNVVICKETKKSQVAHLKRNKSTAEE